MKLYLLILLLALLALGAFATAPQKAIIVTYPSDTPSSVMDEAMAEVEKAGGQITHVYNLIKGFAAKTSEKSLDVIKTLGAKYNPVVQEDSIVSIDGHLTEQGHVH